MGVFDLGARGVMDLQGRRVMFRVREVDRLEREFTFAGDDAPHPRETVDPETYWDFENDVYDVARVKEVFARTSRRTGGPPGAGGGKRDPGLELEMETVLQHLPGEQSSLYSRLAFYVWVPFSAVECEVPDLLAESE